MKSPPVSVGSLLAIPAARAGQLLVATALDRELRFGRSAISGDRCRAHVDSEVLALAAPQHALCPLANPDRPVSQPDRDLVSPGDGQAAYPKSLAGHEH